MLYASWILLASAPSRYTCTVQRPISLVPYGISDMDKWNSKYLVNRHFIIKHRAPSRFDIYTTLLKYWNGDICLLDAFLPVVFLLLTVKSCGRGDDGGGGGVSVARGVLQDELESRGTKRNAPTVGHAARRVRRGENWLNRTTTRIPHVYILYYDVWTGNDDKRGHALRVPFVGRGTTAPRTGPRPFYYCKRFIRANGNDDTAAEGRARWRTAARRRV